MQSRRGQQWLIGMIKPRAGLWQHYHQSSRASQLASSITFWHITLCILLAWWNEHLVSALERWHLKWLCTWSVQRATWNDLVSGACFRLVRSGRSLFANLQVLITRPAQPQQHATAAIILIVILTANVIASSPSPFCFFSLFHSSSGESFFILLPSASHSDLQPASEPSNTLARHVISICWPLVSVAVALGLLLAVLTTERMFLCLNCSDQKSTKHRAACPTQSVISHFGLCLLVGCLLPERAQLSFLSPPIDSNSSASWRLGSIMMPKPLPLHSANDNSTNQICPATLTTGGNADSSSNATSYSSNATSKASGHNPCLCYGLESNAIFLECTSAEISQINATLSHLRPYQNAVRSVSIYRLNESHVGSLPDLLFEPFSSITELHISSSNLSQIGNDLTFAGLEDCLQTLSFVNSQISSIPKSTLSKLRQLQSLDIQANRIANLDSYAFYGLPLRTLNLQNNIIESLHEFAFGGLENTLEELSLIGNRLTNFPLFALRRLRKLLTLKLQSNLISQIPDDGFTRFTLLETLDLQSNQVRHLNSRTFITMPKLRTLYCSSNLLTVVSDSSIFAPLHHLETLDLSLNRLRVVNLDGLESIRTLDISYNHLHDLRLQGMLGLRELFASHNNILQLVNETFLNTTALEVLYLQHNSIHSILYNAFHRLSQLRVLDLSFNQLRLLHSSLFKHTSLLESLYLDNNLISDSGLDSGIFQELVSAIISILDLPALPTNLCAVALTNLARTMPVGNTNYREAPGIECQKCDITRLVRAKSDYKLSISWTAF